MGGTPKTAKLPKRISPMMVVIIQRALTDETGITIEDAVRSAAVHAWYEGHVEGEDSIRPVSPGVSMALADLPDEVFPMLPFPTVPPVQALVRETMATFGEGVPVAAVAYAAAVAWRDGFEEGRVCPGCSFRGAAPEIARELRAATAKIRIHASRDVEERAFDAYVTDLVRGTNRASENQPPPRRPRRPRSPRASRA